MTDILFSQFEQPVSGGKWTHWQDVYPLDGGPMWSIQRGEALVHPNWGMWVIYRPGTGPGFYNLPETKPTTIVGGHPLDRVVPIYNVPLWVRGPFVAARELAGGASLEVTPEAGGVRVVVDEFGGFAGVIGAEAVLAVLAGWWRPASAGVAPPEG